MPKQPVKTLDIDKIIAESAAPGGAPRKVPRILALFDDEVRAKIESCIERKGPDWSDQRIANIINDALAVLGHDETIGSGAVGTHRRDSYRRESRG